MSKNPLNMVAMAAKLQYLLETYFLTSSKIVFRLFVDSSKVYKNVDESLHTNLISRCSVQSVRTITSACLKFYLFTHEYRLYQF